METNSWNSAMVSTIYSREEENIPVMLTQVGEHNFDKSSESSTTGKPVWQKLWKIWIPS